MCSVCIKELMRAATEKILRNIAATKKYIVVIMRSDSELKKTKGETRAVFLYEF